MANSKSTKTSKSIKESPATRPAKRKAGTPADEPARKRSRNDPRADDDDYAYRQSPDFDISNEFNETEWQSGPNAQDQFEIGVGNTTLGRGLSRGQRNRQFRAHPLTTAVSETVTVHAALLGGASGGKSGKGAKRPKSKAKAKAKGKGKAKTNGTDDDDTDLIDEEPLQVRLGNKVTNLPILEDDVWGRPRSRARRREMAEGVKIPRSNPKAVRRILAQRTVAGQVWYFVDWYPGWVKKSSVPVSIEADWRSHEPHTLEWGHDRVMKVDNPTSDDAQPLVQQMIESVLMMYSGYIRPKIVKGSQRTASTVAQELFREHDWEFCNDDERGRAMEAARVAGSVNWSTLQAHTVMQETFTEAWSYKTGVQQASATHRYEDILVQYNGEIDEQSDAHMYQPQKGKTASAFVDPIFADELWDPEYMDSKRWTVERDENEVRAHVQQLKDVVENVARNCPYLLVEPWPRMLVALFFWGTQFEDLVNNDEFQFELMPATGNQNTQRWTWRFADSFIYTYIDECEWELRCVDEVWSTFVNAQMTIDDCVGATADVDDSGPEERPEAGYIREGSTGGSNRGSSKSDTLATNPQRGQPPRMSGENGEGPSGTNNRNKSKAITPPHNDDNDDLYDSPGPRTKAVAQTATKTAHRAGSRPITRSTSNPAPQTGENSLPGTAHKTSKRNETPTQATHKPSTSSGDDTSDSSTTSDDDIPANAPSPASVKKREARKLEKAAQKSSALEKRKSATTRRK